MLGTSKQKKYRHTEIPHSSGPNGQSHRWGKTKDPRRNQTVTQQPKAKRLTSLYIRAHARSILIKRLWNFSCGFCAVERAEMMENGLERSFLDWSCDDVCNWLSSLMLSKDYSSLFRGEVAR